MWTPPNIQVRWGPYFKPDPDEEAKIVDLAIKAKEAKLITTRTAVERIQRIFNIENVDQYEDALEEEAEEHGSTELALGEARKAMAGNVPEPPDSSPDFKDVEPPASERSPKVKK